MKSESIEEALFFSEGKISLGGTARRGALVRPGGVTVVSAAEGVAFIVLWFQYPFWTLRRPRADVCADVSLISNQPAA